MNKKVIHTNCEKILKDSEVRGVSPETLALAMQIKSEIPKIKTQIMELKSKIAKAEKESQAAEDEMISQYAKNEMTSQIESAVQEIKTKLMQLTSKIVADELALKNKTDIREIGHLIPRFRLFPEGTAAIEYKELKTLITNNFVALYILKQLGVTTINLIADETEKSPAGINLMIPGALISPFSDNLLNILTQLFKVPE